MIHFIFTYFILEPLEIFIFHWSWLSFKKHHQKVRTKMKTITKITKNIIPYLYSLPLLYPSYISSNWSIPSKSLFHSLFFLVQKFNFVYFVVEWEKRGGTKKKWVKEPEQPPTPPPAKEARNHASFHPHHTDPSGTAPPPMLRSSQCW